MTEGDWILHRRFNRDINFLFWQNQFLGHFARTTTDVRETSCLNFSRVSADKLSNFLPLQYLSLYKYLYNFQTFHCEIRQHLYRAILFIYLFFCFINFNRVKSNNNLNYINKIAIISYGLLFFEKQIYKKFNGFC